MYMHSILGNMVMMGVVLMGLFFVNYQLVEPFIVA